MPELNDSRRASATRRRNVIAANLLWGCLLLVSIAAGYWAFTAWGPRKPPELSAADISRSTPSEPVNPFAAEHGTNLIVYYFTASDCGWSRILNQHDPVRSLRNQLRSIHGTAYSQVRVIGVDLDTDLDKGLQFLTKSANGSLAGAFDQVIVGGSWLNDQVVRLGWREGIIKPGLPQILVIERPINTEAYVSTLKIEVGIDRVVANLAGDVSIRNWIKQGYPLAKAGSVVSAGRPLN